MSKNDLTKQALRKLASSPPLEGNAPSACSYEGVSEELYDGTSIIGFLLSEAVVYANSVSPTVPNVPPSFGGGFGGGFTSPDNESKPSPPSSPPSSPTIPSKGNTTCIPPSPDEKARIIKGMKQVDSVFLKIHGNIYASPQLRQYPRILGSIKLLYVTSPTFRKRIERYALGQYTLRFHVANLGTSEYMITEENSSRGITTITINSKYIVNGEFQPILTKPDNLEISYTPNTFGYATKVFASLLTHEAIHAEHFTILYDSCMKGYDRSQLHDYLISEGFSEEFADAFARIHPDYVPQNNPTKNYQDAMHQFMKRHCRDQIGRAVDEAMLLFDIITW